MTGQRAEPGIDRVHGLYHAGEVAPLDQFLDETQPFVGDTRIFVPDRDGRGDIGLTDQVGAEFLKRRVGIHRLVVSIGIDER